VRNLDIKERILSMHIEKIIDSELDPFRAWQAASLSLKRVQQQGGALEKEIRALLNWPTGRIIYHDKLKYDVQVDCVYPSLKSPKVVISVTYTEPDTKGHSNENKLQLKVGELALIKCAYPNCKVVLVIGGNEESWLPYVLKAFKFFFDEVVYAWHDDGLTRLAEIQNNPDIVSGSHDKFWKQIKNEWDAVGLKQSDFSPPKGLLRYKIADQMKNQTPGVHYPNSITNRIAALCMQRSKSKEGKEWQNYLNRQWEKIEQSRSYFNPLESLVEISLRDANLKFQGGIACDIPVSSFLHDLGMENTMLSEDFILYSKKHKMKVYIQCKASGGGRNQTGKNIQNRTKEQVTRGILYRCKLENDQIVLKPKNFLWISILDGDWGVTKKNTHKYIHMLQHAGYDHFFGSEDLVDKELQPLPPGKNPLTEYLINVLECSRNTELDEC
jgi:hypothetical protein